MNVLENDSANISMDFLTAISVLMISLVYAVSAIPTFFTPYTAEDNFPHLDSTLSVLLSPNNENGLAIPHTDILDGEIVSQHYVTHENDLNWYELSDTQTFRIFGFEKYQYYSQITPIDDIKYDVQLAEQSAKNYVPELENVELVVRFKTLEYTESGVFYGKDLYGKYHPTKVIIYFDEEDINDINGNITMTFKDFVPKKEAENGKIKTFRVGTEIGASKEVDPVKLVEPIVTVNGNFVDITGGVDINLTDIVKIEVPENELNMNLPNWQGGFYFQFDFDAVIIQNGTTYYNSSIHEISEPYKISMWSW